MYNEASPSSIQIADLSVLPTKLLRNVWVGMTYEAFPSYTRNIHRVGGPVCTFAYAVTLEGAIRLKNWASTTGEAFDIKMHRGCKDGALNCLTVTPEVIHHQRMMGTPSLSRTLALRDDSVEGGSPSEGEAGYGESKEHTMEISKNELNVGGNRVFTHNIMHSARCNWDRGEDELVQCLPNKEEWEEFRT